MVVNDKKKVRQRDHRMTVANIAIENAVGLESILSLSLLSFYKTTICYIEMGKIKRTDLSVPKLHTV
jgi:hypothetical protein